MRTYFASLVFAYFVSLLSLLLSGCTDARRAQIASFGSPGKITCYSGGRVIFDGSSTGKIATEQNSDGWFFEDAATGKLVRISGDCVVRN